MGADYITSKDGKLEIQYTHKIKTAKLIIKIEEEATTDIYDDELGIDENIWKFDGVMIGIER